MNDLINIGVVTDVGAIAQAAAAAFKAIDDVLIVLNSPAMIQARKNADIQAALLKMDADLIEAQKTGDITKIDKEASG